SLRDRGFHPEIPEAPESIRGCPCNRSCGGKVGSDSSDPSISAIPLFSVIANPFEGIIILCTGRTVGGRIAVQGALLAVEVAQVIDWSRYGGREGFVLRRGVHATDARDRVSLFPHVDAHLAVRANLDHLMLNFGFRRLWLGLGRWGGRFGGGNRSGGGRCRGEQLLALGRILLLFQQLGLLVLAE